MPIICQGLVLIFCIYLSLAFMIGRANLHQVKFLNQACIVPFTGYHYKTCRVMRVTIDAVNYKVPRDFETDLASIPRLLWPIFAPQYSGFVAPAILHDYLYHCKNNITREFADEVLYSALLAEKVTSFTAYKFYLGVRLFGSFHFNHGVCS